METKEGQFSVGEKTFHYFLLLLENAVQIFMYGDDEKLGTVAVGTPLPEESRAISSTVLGDRSKVSAAIAEAIAERFAMKSSKIALVSCHLNFEIEKLDLLKAAFKEISI